MTNRERIDAIVKLTYTIGQFENPSAEIDRQKVAGLAPEMIQNSTNLNELLKERLAERVDELVALMGG